MRTQRNARVHLAAALCVVALGLALHLSALEFALLFLAIMGPGLELIPPGLVWTSQWRPDGADPIPERPQDARIYGAVAKMPHA